MSLGETEMHKIQFGSKVIDFRLEYSDRKSLGISVTPEMTVLVKAPVGISMEIVEEKIRKKAPWIIKQQSFFISFQPKTPQRKYISGETHLYLGKQYRIKIMNNELEMNNEFVKLRGQFFEVYTNDRNKIKELLKNWYHKKAKEKLAEIAQPLIVSFLERNTKNISNHSSFITQHLSLRNMQTRWGSCTQKGKIILNPELIKAPKGCIEYVIIHELCHLIHHDHTQKFLDLQTKEMKDWEKWKMKLEKLLA
jgi:predicted metal-dependent hydrolase